MIDGPFTETGELVAGFWPWDVKDIDKAVACIKRRPNPMPGPSEIDIQPFYECRISGWKAETRRLIGLNPAARGAG